MADGELLRSATSYPTMAEDTLDMNTGTALPRGLQNEEPGLYAPAHITRLLRDFPQVEHEHLDDLNHYTVVMSQRGAQALAPLVRSGL